MDTQQVINDRTELYSRLQSVRYNLAIAHEINDLSAILDLRLQSKLIQLELIKLEQLLTETLH